MTKRNFYQCNLKHVGWYIDSLIQWKNSYWKKWKHCGKRGNFSFAAISPFAIMFSKVVCCGESDYLWERVNPIPTYRHFLKLLWQKKTKRVFLLLRQCLQLYSKFELLWTNIFNIFSPDDFNLFCCFCCTWKC